MTTRFGQRRSQPAGEASEPAVERTGHVLRVRSVATARQVLRARTETTQAGFTAEAIPKGFLKHHPILMSDGPLHDEQRKKVARFLAPAVVAERYTASMERAADRLLGQAMAGESFLLDEIALPYTVEVTAELVGLTNSSINRMSNRLVSFFRQPPFDITRADLGRTPRQWMMAAVNGLGPIIRFYFADVRPAIRQRRREPGNDIISHLIAQDYTDADILVECMTYGTAGMVTTREFITMAAWHLLTNEPIAQRFAVAEQAERHAILNEIIRLEPVVGHLYRRAQTAFAINDGGQDWPIQPGDLLDVCIRPANADTESVGKDPYQLCPGRDLAAGVNEAVLSFGDGPHKCPGQPLALLEADVLLSRLLAAKPRILSEPEMTWEQLIEGYALRGLRLTTRA